MNPQRKQQQLRFLLSMQMTESACQGFTVPEIHSTFGGSLRNIEIDSGYKLQQQQIGAR